MKNINLEDIEKSTGEKIESLKVSAGTIRRTITLIVQGIISIAGIAWGQDILVKEGVINNVIGSGELPGTYSVNANKGKIGVYRWK